MNTENKHETKSNYVVTVNSTCERDETRKKEKNNDD